MKEKIINRMKTGHIELKDNKVIFVYHELEKPIKGRYFYQSEYEMDMRKYETSKRSVEVSNVEKENDGNYGWLEWIDEGVQCKPINHLIKDNQPCKAEVNETATIIELITIKTKYYESNRR